MKSLYTYLLTEARGLLRKQYDSTQLIEFITDLVVSNFDNFTSSLVSPIVTDDILKQVYPEWISKLLIYVRNAGDNTIAAFEQKSAKLVEGKLDFRIHINALCIRKYASNNYQSKTSGLVMRRMIEQTLQHELKHAFDEWVRLSKNIQHSYEKYFEDKESLSYLNFPTHWNHHLQTSHYLLSKYEMTANQQGLLYFYKHNALGQLYIKVLKSKWPTVDKFIKVIIDMNHSQYYGFNKMIAVEMKSILKDEVTIEELIPIIRNPYIDNLWFSHYMISMIDVASDDTCSHVMSKIEHIDFHGIKILKTGSARERLTKLFKDIEDITIKYLQKRILNRLYK